MGKRQEKGNNVKVRASQDAKKQGRDIQIHTLPKEIGETGTYGRKKAKKETTLQGNAAHQKWKQTLSAGGEGGVRWYRHKNNGEAGVNKTKKKKQKKKKIHLDRSGANQEGGEREDLLSNKDNHIKTLFKNVAFGRENSLRGKMGKRARKPDSLANAKERSNEKR